MKKEPTVAIVGATGVVGNELIAVINDMKVAFGELKLFASERSKGEVYGVLDEEVVVETVDEGSFQGVDAAVFAVNQSLAAEFVPHALKAGAAVIDTSAAFRNDPHALLVAAGINDDTITAQTRLIAAPAASVVQLAPLLREIDRAAGLKRVVVTVLQSVSAAGKPALDELWDQTLAVFRQSEVVTEVFQHQIAFNCIPQVDLLLESGDTKEEQRIVAETRRLLGLPELALTVTAVRVPIFHCHSMSINVETERPLAPEELTGRLTGLPGINVADVDGAMPLTVVGSSENCIGRVRRDASVANGLAMWSVADNIRTGVAVNAARILQRLLECA